MQEAAQHVSAESFDHQRQTMVDCQIRTFDVTDSDVITRFERVPREIFVPGPLRTLAYSDAPLEVADGQGGRRALLTPLVLARMIQGAQIRPGDRVLDVGGASGYTAAIVAGLAAEVVALESSAAFSQQAAANAAALGLSNVRTATGSLDGAGLTGPFDVIIVNGAVEAGLDPLIGLLSPQGRLVAIDKSTDDSTGRAAKATRFDRVGADASRRPLFDAGAPVLPGFERPRAFVF